MGIFHKLGGRAWEQRHELRFAAAVIGTVLYLSFQPRNWTRSIRDAFARQLLVIGVEPVLFVSGMAVIVGVSLVVQLVFWTGEAGQSQFLGPLLVAVVARELGPLLTNVIVIVRNSTAMTAELAILQINGQVRALEAQGTDTFLRLVFPRVLGMTLATLCLTVIFIFIAFASGYLFGTGLGMGNRDVWAFTSTVFNALHFQDMLSIVVKSLIPALFTSASCCIGGLSVGSSVSDIPAAVQHALTRSLAGLFVISAVVSLLTYLRV